MSEYRRKQLGAGSGGFLGFLVLHVATLYDFASRQNDRRRRSPIADRSFVSKTLSCALNVLAPLKRKIGIAPAIHFTAPFYGLLSC